VSFKSGALLDWLRTRGSDGRRVVVRLAPEKRAYLETVARHLAGGRLRGAIGQSFDLDDAAGAHRAVEAGTTRGHVLLNV
jgi:NADPH:quinone reductase-like Zn-dependent oxidoreductase